MHREHYNLNKLVESYKNTDDAKEKNAMFFSIRGHLIHHLNAVIAILKGTDYDGNR